MSHDTTTLTVTEYTPYGYIFLVNVVFCNTGGSPSPCSLSDRRRPDGSVIQASGGADECLADVVLASGAGRTTRA